MEKYGKAEQGQMTKRNAEPKRFPCQITEARIEHLDSEYVVLIAVPLQQWLHELASELRHTYIACLVFVYIL